MGWRGPCISTVHSGNVSWSSCTAEESKRRTVRRSWLCTVTTQCKSSNMGGIGQTGCVKDCCTMSIHVHRIDATAENLNGTALGKVWTPACTAAWYLKSQGLCWGKGATSEHFCERMSLNNYVQIGRSDLFHKFGSVSLYGARNSGANPYW